MKKENQETINLYVETHEIITRLQKKLGNSHAENISNILSYYEHHFEDKRDMIIGFVKNDDTLNKRGKKQVVVNNDIKTRLDIMALRLGIRTTQRLETRLIILHKIIFDWAEQYEVLIPWVR